ncbi:MAG: hypothetical protein KDC54_22345 [Lewinella sp.]|nr:hypothetical protein [Lewinella sp.]
MVLVFVLPLRMLEPDGLEEMTKVRIALSILAMFITAWGWWNFILIKWQLWVYRHLPEDRWLAFYRTILNYGGPLKDQPDLAWAFLRSRSDQQRLQHIMTQLAEWREIDLVKVDLLTSTTVQYRVDATLIVLYFMWTVICIGTGVHTILSKDHFAGYLLILLGCLYPTFLILTKRTYLRFFLSRRPFLVIDNTSIQVGNQVIAWTDMEHIHIDYIDKEMSIRYQAPTDDQSQRIEIDLNFLAIDDLLLFFNELEVFHDRFIQAHGTLDDE